jgi:hypothetical protein
MLGQRDYRTEAAAIDQLAVSGDTSAIPVLLDILRQRQLATIADDVYTGVLAWRAVCALGKLGGVEHIPTLLAAASEEFSLLRGAVAISLTEIALRTNDLEAVRVVVRALSTFLDDAGIVSVFKRQRVRHLAAAGLQRIRNKHHKYSEQIPLSLDH